MIKGTYLMKNFSFRAALALCAAVSLAGFSNPAFASSWTGRLGSDTYSFTTISGSISELSDTLQSQPWWGDADLAQQASALVGSHLGAYDLAADFGVHAGPIFLSFVDGSGVAYGAFEYDAVGGTYHFSGVSAPNSYTFVKAVMMVAPEIDAGKMPLALLLLGLLGIAARRRRGGPAHCG